MMGMVVKANIGELEEDVRAGSLRRMRKYLNGVVQEVYGKKGFFVSFQDGCKIFFPQNNSPSL